MESDPVAHRMAVFPPRARDAFERHWKKIMQNKGGLTRTVLVDGVVAGNVVAWDQAGERCTGYWIDRALWGRGIATSALTQLLAIETERPLYAQVAESNTGSRRVLEKCGFVQLRVEEYSHEDPADAFIEVTYVMTAS